MKKIFGWVALLVGMVTGANAQVNDTIQRTTGNDLYQGTVYAAALTKSRYHVRTAHAVVKVQLSRKEKYRHAVQAKNFVG